MQLLSKEGEQGRVSFTKEWWLMDSRRMCEKRAAGKGRSLAKGCNGYAVRIIAHEGAFKKLLSR